MKGRRQRRLSLMFDHRRQTQANSSSKSMGCGDFPADDQTPLDPRTALGGDLSQPGLRPLEASPVKALDRHRPLTALALHASPFLTARQNLAGEPTSPLRALPLLTSSSGPLYSPGNVLYLERKLLSAPPLYAPGLSDPGQTRDLKEDGHAGPAPFLGTVVAHANRIFDVAVTRVEGLEQVDGFLSANLADDDVGRAGGEGSV